MRRQPVAFALIDAAFLADSKFRGLRRRLPEPRDFNSAVGAWLIVLTSARRNGLPEVDAEDEAEDATFLKDLLAVGLLSETGIPEKPFKAWAPARPKYQSDLVTSATKVTGATSSPFPTPDSVSTPFPSTQLSSPPKVNRPRARNSIDRDPLLREMREAIVKTNGVGMDTAMTPAPLTLPVAVDLEKEGRRKEAFDLHERFLDGEISEQLYDRLLEDIGKEPDDLTRYQEGTPA